MLMCGIFAYRGSQDASQVVLKGLQDLQYRGYDSWGIATLSNNTCKIEKNIGALPKKLDSLESSHLALGHTRWATHGGVSIANSHPHLSCDERFVVVHNGIIENYKAIRSKLSKNHIFKSNTDTEVIVHYIEEKITTLSFKKSLERLVKKISGHSAFVVIDTQTQNMFAYRSGSPLVLGKKGENLYISSDLPSLATFVEDIYPLAEGELIDASGKLGELAWVPSPKMRISKQVSSTRYHMESEMYETSEILKSIENSGTEKFIEISNHLTHDHNVILTGCGSSYHACLFGQYLFSQNGIITRAIVASEGGSSLSTINSSTTIIVLSQSGETIDSLDYVVHAKAKGAFIIALTNVPYSSLDRIADIKLDLGVGLEVAVASTKAFIFMQLFFARLSAFIAKHNHAIKIATYHKKLLSLYKNPNKKIIQNLAKELVPVTNLFVISHGDLIPLGYEAALKFKEIGYMHAENIVSGELKHGPLALINKDSVCLVLCRKSSHELDHTVAEIIAREGKVIKIEIPDLGVLTSLYGSNYIHLLSFYHSVLLGHNPDRPRNLAKSVTVK